MEALFQSEPDEYHKPRPTTVAGKIPDWIEGSLYRNGPAKFEFGGTGYNHWFDGMAKLHRFHISKGKVTYQSRFIQSDVYRKNMEANRIICSEFGTMAYPDPCKTLFERVFSYFSQPPATDNTVVNVFPVGECLCAATETNFVQRIDPETLETKEKVDLTKVVSLNGATAHPHLDPNGDVYNMGAIHAGGTKYTIVKLTPPKKGEDVFCEKAEIVAQIPAQWKIHPSYFHSFGITPNYFIFIEQPLVINVLKIFTARIRGKSFADALEYYPEYYTKFHIVDRSTGEEVNQAVEYCTDSFFTFHHINAYEEDGELVVDTCAMTDPNLFLGYWLSKLQRPNVEDYLAGFPGSKAWRFVLPLNLTEGKYGQNLVKNSETTATAVLESVKGKKKTGRVYLSKDELCPSLAFDFPQINYWNKNGKKYRYVYGAGYINTQLDCIIKLDLETRDLLKWHTPGTYPSEPVFVAAPGGQAEDDGVLLSVILTTGESRGAYLLVLDAKTLKEIGRAETDARIGRDTHGMFVSGF